MSEFVPHKPSCLIDEILPTHRVHLLGGVSDAGKTRFIVPTMLQWEKGLPVMGRTSHPRPWAYVVGDRSMREAAETMATMGIDVNAIRCIPAFGAEKRNRLAVLTMAQQMKPVPELLVWEGFQDVCGEKKHEVQNMLSEMNGHCEDKIGFPKGLTVLGIVESPKLKPNERYPNPRSRVSGVSAWGYHSSTILLIEGTEADPSLCEPHRVVWVCSKIARRRQLLASFNERGQLLIVNGPPPKKKLNREPLPLEFPILQVAEK